MAIDPGVTAAALGDAAGGFGFLALFWQADLVVKAVMLILLGASVWCWAVIIDKSVRLGRLKRKTKAFEDLFWSGGPLDGVQRQLGRNVDHPAAGMFVAAMDEWREGPPSRDSAGYAGLIERVRAVMRLSLDRDMSELERSLGSLATIGSAAPFVGLFGTVWGIMSSFQAIAITKNTTLAVVAPGIAEALLATAMGLVAAIPAVVAYNKLSGEIDRFADRLGAFADEFALILARDVQQVRAAA
jgi:biopolymer transport protein TolQ